MADKSFPDISYEIVWRSSRKHDHSRVIWRQHHVTLSRLTFDLQ